MSTLDFIKECQEKVFSGIGISFEDAEKLFDIPDVNLKELAKCANEITRDFNGSKVDVEQLNNIKKMHAVKTVHFVDNLRFLIQESKHTNYQLLKR